MFQYIYNSCTHHYRSSKILEANSYIHIKKEIKGYLKLEQNSPHNYNVRIIASVAYTITDKAPYSVLRDNSGDNSEIVQIMSGKTRGIRLGPHTIHHL